MSDTLVLQDADTLVLVDLDTLLLFTGVVPVNPLCISATANPALTITAVFVLALPMTVTASPALTITATVEAC